MKAVLNADGTFRMLVPDDASTASEQTRAWVPTEPPVPGDGDVVEPDAPLVGPETVTQQFEYSNTTERDHPLIEALGAQVGLNRDQLDDLFVLGASLE